MINMKTAQIKEDCERECMEMGEYWHKLYHVEHFSF